MGFKLKNVFKAVAAAVAAPVKTFIEATKDASNAVVYKPLNQVLVKPISKAFSDTSSVMKDLHDPTNPLGVMADPKDRLAAASNAAQVTELAKRSANAVAAKDNANRTRLSSHEQELDRKGTGRASTLLTGPTGLTDGPKISRRVLLGY
jgi:hypothetical protein